MDDFISREAVISKFCDDCMDKEWCKRNGESCSGIKNINAVPAADVRPVVRGKWIRGNESRTSPIKDSYICSVCGEKTLSGFCGNPAKTNFCPNCGADMREPQTLKNASQNADDDAMMPAV